MEFTGTVNLVEDQAIYISHDDSVALKIDGTQVLTSGNGAFITGYQFTGKTGSHRVDLVFANGCGIGYLSFSPAM